MTVVVTILQPVPPYAVGDRAAFSEARAVALVRTGFAAFAEAGRIAVETNAAIGIADAATTRGDRRQRDMVRK